MNILTFDIEEWYLEKTLHGGRAENYRQYDEMFAKLLDELDGRGVKATFFCVGRLATDFPQVVKEIAQRGHEVGCHSNEHTWLNKMTEVQLRHDTTEAIKALEDVSGQKVVSYRAPAFSITQENMWSLNVLVDCGIKVDASIFPASRDFGGYKGFPTDMPCIISHDGVTLKEFPISLTTIMGKKMAYSGGGYFRLLPYWLVSKTTKGRDYNICYFHLADLITEQKKLMTKSEYEQYFKEKGTMKNRLARYVKSNVGTGDAYGKMSRLLTEYVFTSLKEADKMIDWSKVGKVEL